MNEKVGGWVGEAITYRAQVGCDADGGRLPVHLEQNLHGVEEGGVAPGAGHLDAVEDDEASA